MIQYSHMSNLLMPLKKCCKPNIKLTSLQYNINEINQILTLIESSRILNDCFPDNSIITLGNIIQDKL